LNQVNKFLAQYTFEPVTTKEAFDDHSLVVKNDSRLIPLGRFKVRLKNINDQHYYDLTLNQKLTLTTSQNGLALKPRLHGVKIRHAKHPTETAGFKVMTTLKIKHAPADVQAPKQRRSQAAAAVPVTNHQATALPTTVPVYAFKDSKQLAINQTALAKLFLAADLGPAA